jgi:hypothetical protein
MSAAKRSGHSSASSFSTHGSRILRVVCAKRDRAAYRCPPGRSGACGDAVARGRGRSDEPADGALPGCSSGSAPARPPAGVQPAGAPGRAGGCRPTTRPAWSGPWPRAGGPHTPTASAPATRGTTGGSTRSPGRPAPATSGAATRGGRAGGPSPARPATPGGTPGWPPAGTGAPAAGGASDPPAPVAHRRGRARPRPRAPPRRPPLAGVSGASRLRTDGSTASARDLTTMLGTAPHVSEP